MWFTCKFFPTVFVSKIVFQCIYWGIKKPGISGSMQFKPVLFKGQLFYSYPSP